MNQDRWDSKNLYDGSPTDLIIFKTHIKEFIIDNGTHSELIFQIWGGVDLNTEVDNASAPISKTPINKITLINKHLGLHNHVDTFEQPKRTKVPVLKAIIICRELVVMNTHDCG